MSMFRQSDDGGYTLEVEAQRDQLRAEVERLKAAHKHAFEGWKEEVTRTQRLEAALRKARADLDEWGGWAAANTIDRALVEESKP